MKLLLLLRSTEPAEPLVEQVRQQLDLREWVSQKLVSTHALIDALPQQDRFDAAVLWGGLTTPDELQTLRSLTRSQALPPLVVIGPGLSPEAAVQHLAAGALDAVDWPCSDERLELALGKLVLAHTGREAHGQRQDAPRGRRLTVLSGKGGSGASFVAVNLAYALAGQLQQRTLLIDLDMAFGDASFALTEARHPLDWASAATHAQPDAAFALSACFQVHDHLWLLQSPTAARLPSPPTPEQLGALIDLLVPQFDWVLMDLDRHLDAYALQALDRCEQVLQVMLPQAPDLRDARLQRQNLIDLGLDASRLSLLLNRCGAFGPAEAQVLAQLQPPVFFCLDNDAETAVMSANAGESVLLLSPKSPLALQFVDLARKITHQAMPKRSWVDRARTFIFSS